MKNILLRNTDANKQYCFQFSKCCAWLQGNPKLTLCKTAVLELLIKLISPVVVKILKGLEIILNLIDLVMKRFILKVKQTLGLRGLWILGQCEIIQAGIWVCISHSRGVTCGRFVTSRGGHLPKTFSCPSCPDSQSYLLNNNTDRPQDAQDVKFQAACVF